MTVLLMMLASAAFLALAGRAYSGYITRAIGMRADRTTPAVTKNDGRDYVPSPTPVVFAHHFASIAGAGPIIGPVIAVVYGWVPALLWVTLGGVLIGGVHDYLALYLATREGGQSIATIAQRLLGKGVFLALMVFLILLLVLVCAAFLNLSAIALTSMLPFDRIGLSPDQSLFRVVEDQVVIGGIASMSVIVITVCGPLLGWLYLKKKVSVLWCSLLAIGICAISIMVGLYQPVAIPDNLLGWGLSGMDCWRLLLAAYVLIAAGLPVWIFLQSRDFINVHLLYLGLAVLVVTLLVAGFRGIAPPAEGALPAFNAAEGEAALGWIWPGLFITIACGAVSGFHSLCAGGTTCKQIRTEKATRQIGYYGMTLESFLSVCVIGALLLGAAHGDYLNDVHPGLLNADHKANSVLGFAMSVGNAMHRAFGAPIAVGALAGMILLEGFLVTTLDTAVRLTRYLIEEVWRVMFARYDVFAPKVAMRPVDVSDRFATGDESPTGAGGLPATPPPLETAPAPLEPIATRGPMRWLLQLLRHYWVNSGIAVGLTLLFAFSGGQKALWGIFATANQLLAALVLAIAALWLLNRKRRAWFAFLPAVAMLATTATSLFMMLNRYLRNPMDNLALLVADVVIIAITVYLLIAGINAAVGCLRRSATQTAAE